MTDIPNKHIMIDIETLGKRPGAPVVSIGAVWFDPEDNGWLPAPGDDEFYAEVHLEDAMAYGCADPSTIAWWMGQSDEARAFLTKEDGKTHLSSALIELDHFIARQVQDKDRRDVYVWANGPEFDVSILDAMYHAVGLCEPWNYARAQSCRTILWAARTFFGAEKPPFRAGRTAHNALDDAKHQAEYITRMVRTLRGMVPDGTVRTD